MERRQHQDQKKTGKFAEKFNDSALKFRYGMDVGEEIIQRGGETADADSPDSDTGKKRRRSGPRPEDGMLFLMKH